MAFLRPEAVAALHRWREIAAAAAVLAAGLWLASFGGPFFAVLGGAVGAVGAGFGLLAWRRMRFAGTATDPGVVEVVEGQIGYFGPRHGGYVALSDLAEIALVRRYDHRFWRLAQGDGTVLFIPVAATGAEALFDAFAGLPGLGSSALLAALNGTAGVDRIVWRHRARLRLT